MSQTVPHVQLTEPCQNRGLSAVLPCSWRCRLIGPLEARKSPRETLSVPSCVYVFTYCCNRPFSSSFSRFNAILSGSARSERGSPIQLPAPPPILITLIRGWKTNKWWLISKLWRILWGDAAEGKPNVERLSQMRGY